MRLVISFLLLLLAGLAWHAHSINPLVFLQSEWESVLHILQTGPDRYFKRFERNWGEYFTNAYVMASTLAMMIAFLIDFVARYKPAGRGWRRAWQECSLHRLFIRRTLSARTDMLLFIYSKLALEAFVIPIISVFGIVFVYTWILATLDFRLLDGIESNLLKAIIYIMALDFSGYVYHVLCHKIPFLWEIHKFHHSSTEMNLITGTRDHPVERAIKKIFEALPLAILGAPTEVFLSLAILQYSLGIFSHSDFNLHYGKIGYILISPLAHRIHHSVLKEHWDRNYGSTFSLWDYIFGTAYKGNNFKPQIDVTNNYFNQRGFLYDLTMPVVKSVKVAIKGRYALAQLQRNPV